jgi:hypothetical protein
MQIIMQLNSFAVTIIFGVFISVIALIRGKKLQDILFLAIGFCMAMMSLFSLSKTAFLLSTGKLTICTDLADVEKQLSIGVFICIILNIGSICLIVQKAWKNQNE